jgi:D-xylose transport system permease protein
VKLEPSVARSKAPSQIAFGTWAMAGVLLLMWIGLAVMPATRGVFLTRGNLTNLLLQGSVLLVISVGMTMVIVIRGIDLSVGSGVALTGMIAALCHVSLGLPVPVAMAAALVVGAMVGALHGFWVGWLGVPAFIVTLAGLKAYRGAALVISDAKGVSRLGFDALVARVPVCATWILVLATLALGLGITIREATRRKQLGLEPTPTNVIGLRIAGQLALAAGVLAIFAEHGIPVPVLVAAAVALAGIFVTKRTRFGRHMYAIGGNPEAARLSGVDVRKVTIGVYAILGLLTALAGLLLAARTDGVTPGTQGNLLELDAVTAVVIGGTSLLGGRGSITGTVLGALVFATLANGMNHLHVSSNWQLIFTGTILLAAGTIDVLSKGKRS